MDDVQRKEFYLKNNIEKELSVDEIKKTYINAVKKHKTVIGKIYSIPGAKMIFQGDEYASLAYFKFFRQFSTGIEYCLRDKGYEPGLEAFLGSKLDSVDISDEYTYINKGVERFTSDLNTLAEKNMALNDGHIEKTTVNEQADIHAIHARKMYNEIFSVSNFSDKHWENYGIMFPKGQWRELVNSNGELYAGDNKYLNRDKVFENFSYIQIPDNGIIFFEKL